GNGAVAIHSLMEDAATAEISRSQVWQQIANKVTAVDTGQTITAERVSTILDEEVARLREELQDDERFQRYFEPAAEISARITTGREEDFVDFMTLPAYEVIDWCLSSKRFWTTSIRSWPAPMRCSNGPIPVMTADDKLFIRSIFQPIVIPLIRHSSGDSRP